MHCPNTGAMTGCDAPDSPIWYSTSGNPKRKYAHTWELVETEDGHRVGINSAFANALVDEALARDGIPELEGYESRVREAPVPDAQGRFDFRLEDPARPACFVEVKSVTLCASDGLGLFPDAVSDRAVRHVEALARRVVAGDRGVLLFLAQHTGIERVACADHVHPAYGEAVGQARDVGVEVLAYGASVVPDEVRLATVLPFINGESA